MSLLRNCRIYSSKEEKRGKFPDRGFPLNLGHSFSFLVIEHMEELDEFSSLRDERMIRLEL